MQLEKLLGRSEGFARTGYLVPARGLGGGWEIHVSSAVAAAAPWLGPQKGGFSGQRFCSPLGPRKKISTHYYRGFARICGPRLFCFDEKRQI